MLPRHLLFTLSLSLFAAAACATGGELPDEQGLAPLSAKTEEDSGPTPGSIKATNPAPSSTATPDASAPETSATDSGTVTPEASTPEAAPPPPPPPTTPVCDPSKSSYGLLVITLIGLGAPPPQCSAGACGGGECCYNGSYCLPE